MEGSSGITLRQLFKGACDVGNEEAGVRSRFEELSILSDGVSTPALRPPPCIGERSESTLVLPGKVS